MDKGKQNKRKYDRYTNEAKVYFRVTYDLTTKVQFQVRDKTPPKKYFALSKNISAEGLCFNSKKKLACGDMLEIDVYVPGSSSPVHMTGEVRWSHEILSSEESENSFDTGVKLTSVDDQSITKTICEDKTHGIIWSIVLESTFGNFSSFVKKTFK